MTQKLISLTLATVLFTAIGGFLAPNVETATVQATNVAREDVSPPEPAIPELAELLRATNPPKPVEAATQEPQAYAPGPMVVTEDGEHAYIGFDLSEVVFKVRLEDFTTEAVADLSEFFPVETSDIVLDASEEKLFVYTPTWQKLLVLDTQTMSVVHTIDDISIYGIIRSQYGPFLITWDGGNAVRFVNTETYEVTELVDGSIGFLGIQESESDQGLWYVLTAYPELGGIVIMYDYETQSWIHSITVPPQAEGENIFDFKVLPNEQKVYMAAFGGWYPDYHAYGWLYSVDLSGTDEVNVVPIDGGALSLETSADSRWVYVGTAWPGPEGDNLLVVDTHSDHIVRSVYLGQTQYGWNYIGTDNLQIDPMNPHILYATSGDANAFISVDLDDLTLAGVRVFNREQLYPSFFFGQRDQSAGYIVTSKSTYGFKFDRDQATIESVVQFPLITESLGDGAIDDAGRMLIAQGTAILEIDAEDLHLIETHLLPSDVPQIWNFILANDQTRLFAVSQDPATPGYNPDTLLVVDTTAFQVQASLKLEGGAFKERPFELPDGSKLYVLGGLSNAPVVIHVIETDNYTIEKTITFDDPDLLGIADGRYHPFAYDASTHTLFVGATQAVLAIDTDADVIEKIIYLGDAARAIGLEPREMTYVNAIGLVYNPHENYLYIAHLDRFFISIYDLNNDRFLPQVIPLGGFFPNFAFANEDYTKIFVLNMRSDSVSVIDTSSKTEVKLIDLRAFLPGMYKGFLPIVLKPAH